MSFSLFSCPSSPSPLLITLHPPLLHHQLSSSLYHASSRSSSRYRVDSSSLSFISLHFHSTARYHTRIFIFIFHLPPNTFARLPLDRLRISLLRHLNLNSNLNLVTTATPTTMASLFKSSPSRKSPKKPQTPDSGKKERRFTLAVQPGLKKSPSSFAGKILPFR